MLLFDRRSIGSKLLAARKRSGMTQVELAEAAGLSGRTYADIERGSVNTRTETLLRICDALYITPDDILTDGGEPAIQAGQNELTDRLARCSPAQRTTALQLLSVYLRSLGK